MTFEVDYAYHILIVLGLIAGIIMIIGMARHSRLAKSQMELAHNARIRKLKERAAREKALKNLATQSSQYGNPVIARELMHVPTPWGWPQHGENKEHGANGHDLSYTLHRFADRLIHEKKTTRDQAYQNRRKASLRALLEDRYGRASRMSEFQYEAVKAPLLRDPGAPHDQMDNFPSGMADALAAKLKRQPGNQPGRVWPVRKGAKSADLKNLKTPWGW